MTSVWFQQRQQPLTSKQPNIDDIKEMKWTLLLSKKTRHMNGKTDEDVGLRLKRNKQVDKVVVLGIR